jgi:class 3 adenylate cyclase/Tol biopolymer transport system component
LEDPKMPEITNSESQTHLSVIMFSDIVGYSKKMQENEDLTMNLLSRHNQIVRDALKKHDGKEIKMIGDAFLVSFTTVANAVRCAIDIQECFAKYNETATEKEKILLRIGIHMGDIIVKDDDVFGDGVNIASRIEPLAEPGGICISQEVYNLVRHKLDLQAVSLGPKELKNIKEKIEIYEILVGSITSNAHKAKKRKKERKNWAYALVGLLVVAVGLLIAIKLLNQPSTPMVTRILKTGSNDASDPNISLDGNWIVYVARDSRRFPSLYVIHSSGGEPRKITYDTSLVDYRSPCFSPDASQIVYSGPYTENNKLEINIISTLGGKSHKLVSDGDLPVWSPDGKHIAFFSSNARELFVVRPDGTEKKKVTEFTIPDFINLAWSPDSKQLAFLRNFETAETTHYTEIFSRKLDDSTEHQITFDKKIIDDFCWTSTGEIVFNSNRGGGIGLWVIPEEGGTPKQLTLGAGADRFPRISKDAKHLVYMNESQTSNLWTIDLQTKELQQLTFEDALVRSVAYSLDGSKLIYWLRNEFESSQDGFVICNKDGSEPVKFAPVLDKYRPFVNKSWFGDMKSVIFNGFRIDTIRKSPDSIVTKFNYFEHELTTNITRKIGDGMLFDISKDGKYLLYVPDLNAPPKAVLALKATPDKIIKEITLWQSTICFSWDSKSALVQDSNGVWSIPLDTDKSKHLIKTPKSFMFLNSVPDDKSILGLIPVSAPHNYTLVKVYYADGRVEEIRKQMPGFGATVSPDGKTVVFIRNERVNKIIVLDNFR